MISKNRHSPRLTVTERLSRARAPTAQSAWSTYPLPDPLLSPAMAQVTDAQVGVIIGAFWSLDVELFRAILSREGVPGGDVAELGVSFGRSAVLIGQYLRPGEQFTCIDLFESPAVESANAAENAAYYPGLSRGAFEANYRSAHGELPTVVTGPSQSIGDHARPGVHRFVHIDASHLYAHVAGDIEAVQPLMQPDGVVVLDDFRAQHTPGVAAAAWQAVIQTGLRPFALSPNKMYATWGDGDDWCAFTRAWADSAGKSVSEESINEHDVLLIDNPPTPPEHPLRRWVPPVAWPYCRRVGTLGRRLWTERR